MGKWNRNSGEWWKGVAGRKFGEESTEQYWGGRLGVDRWWVLACTSGMSGSRVLTGLEALTRAWVYIFCASTNQHYVGGVWGQVMGTGIQSRACGLNVEFHIELWFSFLFFFKKRYFVSQQNLRWQHWTQVRICSATGHRIFQPGHSWGLSGNLFVDSSYGRNQSSPGFQSCSVQNYVAGLAWWSQESRWQPWPLRPSLVAWCEIFSVCRAWPLGGSLVGAGPWSGQAPKLGGAEPWMELLASGCHGGSPQRFYQVHRDAGFSQSLTGAASKLESFTSLRAQLVFPILFMSCMLVTMKMVLGGEDKGNLEVFPSLFSNLPY